MSERVAVVTTFSEEGYSRYARRMVETWAKFWPSSVDLHVFPDSEVPLPAQPNVLLNTAPMPEKEKFLSTYGNDPMYRGMQPRSLMAHDGATYNYRFDVVKFCHKPFALGAFAQWNASLPRPYAGMIWLDADTLTHAEVNETAVELMAPFSYDIQFLGRSYKYSECGYLFFNLTRPKAQAVLEKWVKFYTKGTFKRQREWHDSWLFDLARKSVDGLKEKDLTGHIPKRKGAGHPFVNSFLGLYMDHAKGEIRKTTGKPRKNDLFANHDTPYWRENSHAKSK